jgi:hypothetical protein
MIMKIVGCCFAVGLTLLPYVIHAAELSKSIPEIEKSLSASETILARIQVTEIPVQYWEGKYIENGRSRALKYIQSARSVLPRLYRETRISDLLDSLSLLEGLTGEIESLIYQLGRPMSASAYPHNKASEWATALNDPANSLNRAFLRFKDDTFQFAMRVDVRLENCPP